MVGVVGHEASARVCGGLYGRFCFADISADEGGITCNIGHTRTHMGDFITPPAQVHGRVVMGSVDDGTRVRLWDIDEMVSNYSVDAGDAALFRRERYFPGN